jgi:hypothetical protein
MIRFLVTESELRSRSWLRQLVTAAGGAYDDAFAY